MPITLPDDKEIPVRTYKCRSYTGIGECALCGFWMRFQERVCVTTKFRTVHVGCLAYEKMKEGGHPLWTTVDESR